MPSAPQLVVLTSTLLLACGGAAPEPARPQAVTHREAPPPSEDEVRAAAVDSVRAALSACPSASVVTRVESDGSPESCPNDAEARAHLDRAAQLLLALVVCPDDEPGCLRRVGSLPEPTPAPRPEGCDAQRAAEIGPWRFAAEALITSAALDCRVGRTSPATTGAARSVPGPPRSAACSTTSAADVDAARAALPDVHAALDAIH